MDRLRIIDEIAVIGRGLAKLSEAHRKAISGDLNLINQVQVATARLQTLQDQLRGGIPRPPIVDLQAAISRFLAEHNQNPKPFVWNADPHAIIEKVRRGKQMLESIH